MKYTAAFLALVASVAAQVPPGCSENFSGTFEITPVNVTGTTKRSLIEARQERLERRQVCTNTPIVILKNGILTDQNNRQGEVVANQQFQFDDILQPDALFTTGFSICANGSLAVGGSAIFYSCKSGTFSNLYHESVGAQCGQIYIDTQACDSTSGTPTAATASLTSTSSSSSSSSSSTSSSTLITTSSTSSSSKSSSSSSSSSTPTTTSSTSSTPTSVATTSATTPTVIAPIPVSTSATIIPPFPAGNATTPSATASGSAPVTTTPTTSTTASTTSPATFQPSSGADILAIGGQFFVAAAGVAAFAMF